VLVKFIWTELSSVCLFIHHINRRPEQLSRSVLSFPPPVSAHLHGNVDYDWLTNERTNRGWYNYGISTSMENSKSNRTDLLLKINFLDGWQQHTCSLTALAFGSYGTKFRARFKIGPRLWVRDLGHISLSPLCFYRNRLSPCFINKATTSIQGL
jgi:hypothetical protein